jgi:hypothetical protein
MDEKLLGPRDLTRIDRPCFARARKGALRHVSPFRRAAFAILFVAAPLALASNSAAQETINVGETGFGNKRPVFAAACAHGCPWGELGDFVKEALAPHGYEVILCRNCNRDLGPRLVSRASRPPELGAQDTFVGTTTRVDAPVDFGVTESGFLAWAYHGRFNYQDGGPYDNLRLIAKIEDPTYLLAAVKADSPITSLAQIAQQKMPVKILGGGTPGSQRALDYYGLTSAAVQSWGGSFINPVIAGATGGGVEFDLILNELASPANNPESASWPILSQKFNLRFLDLSEELSAQIAAVETLGMVRASAQWGLLRGIDRAIPTVARSGHAVFARDDAAEQAVYEVAKAIDEHRAALKWYIRPYSYDSRTVHENLDVPLHPGAQRYYREQGYLGSAPVDDADHDADAGACADDGPKTGDDGCGIARGRSSVNVSLALAGAFAVLLAWRRRRV